MKKLRNLRGRKRGGGGRSKGRKKAPLKANHGRRHQRRALVKVMEEPSAEG